MKKDKCLLFCSPLGGYTLPWEDENGKYIINYLDHNAELQKHKVEKIGKHISQMGANSTREFPFWPHEDLLIIEYDGKGMAHFKDKYFDDWRIIVEIYNKYNVQLWFDLFDYCGTRRPFGEYNPWNLPLKNEGSQTLTSGDFFWGNESLWLRKIYIKKILEIFNGLNIGYGICNEMRIGDDTVEIYKKAKMLSETFCQLIDNGVNPKNIILPVQYDWKEQKSEYGKLYRMFRNNIIDHFNENKWGKWLKTKCITPVHGPTLENIKKMLGDNPPEGGDRNIFYDADGIRNPRPTATDLHTYYSYAAEKQPKKMNNGRLNFGNILGKQEKDNFDSFEGIRFIYEDYFENSPGNYKFDYNPLKFKLKQIEGKPVEPKPEPQPPKPKPEPQPPKPEPERKKLRVQKTLEWLKKHWRWSKKHWRWILGISSLAICGLIIFFSPSGLWRIGAALWLLGIAFFGLIKK
jgi:hypothetical protein